MNFKLGRLLLLIVAVFSLTIVTAAQDDDFEDVDTIVVVDPDPAVVVDESSDAAIEAITDNSEDYYGAVVTIDATVSNFLSPRIFEVGEEELLTNSRVLVVNNSSQALPSSLIEGTVVRVTGRVHPSYDVINNGYDWTYEPYGDAMSDEDMNTDEMATEEADMMQDSTMEGSRMNLVSFVHAGYIPGAFGQHTVLEVLNVENVEIVSYEDLITTE
jgi:hypothetical protein